MATCTHSLSVFKCEYLCINTGTHKKTIFMLTCWYSGYCGINDDDTTIIRRVIRQMPSLSTL
jgi:hypothetical protein